MELTETLNKLGQLPIGARLLVRSKLNWRTAVLCRLTEGKAMLSVCSPGGRTYRLHKSVESEIVFDGLIPILKIDTTDTWRDNFSPYDVRW